MCVTVHTSCNFTENVSSPTSTLPTSLNLKNISPPKKALLKSLIRKTGALNSNKELLNKARWQVWFVKSYKCKAHHFWNTDGSVSWSIHHTANAVYPTSKLHWKVEYYGNALHSFHLNINTHFTILTVNCNQDTRQTLVLQFCQKHWAEASSSSHQYHHKHKWSLSFACPHQLILLWYIFWILFFQM